MSPVPVDAHVYWSTVDMLEASINDNPLIKRLEQSQEKFAAIAADDFIEMLDEGSFSTRLGRYVLRGMYIAGRHLITIAWDDDRCFISVIASPGRLGLQGINAYVDETIAVLDELAKTWDPLMAKLAMRVGGVALR